MPHPEAAYATFLHPHHTRNEVTEDILAEGMQIFRNAVEYAQANL
jgi:phosphoribosylformylglycinamidine (FGAM) synthase-like amidotransferase family enzyme